MKKLLWFLFSFFFLISVEVFSQQDGQVGQYMHNKALINPAAAGSDGGNFTLFYRTQWVTMPGSPKSIGAVADIGLQKGVGLGINLLNTTQGSLSFTRILTNYSYKVNLSEDVASLYLGLQAGFVQYSIDRKDLILHDDISLDATFNGENLRKLVPDFGFGVMLKLKNYYVGVSLPHILQPKMKFINQVVDTTVSTERGIRNDFARIFRHYYFTAGGDIEVSQMITLQPHILFKVIANAPLIVDLNMNCLVMDRYWGGLGYRISKPGAIVFMAGLKINTLKFGYAYEATRSPLSSYGGATHELMINYQFKGAPEVRQNKKPYFMK